MTELVRADGTLPRISGIGPASTRVIREILDTGASPTVEAAVDRDHRRADIERRRALRCHFLSRAAVVQILSDSSPHGPRLRDYRGDLQMHSEWSDGAPSLEELASACAARGYAFAAVTDHSYGLKIAGGMSMADAAKQRRAITRLNTASRNRFCLLHGVEANIGPDGALDLSEPEAATFDIVLAAPHARLRRTEDQTLRLLAAIAHPCVRVLAHPRGRMAETRAGVVANWDSVFAAAAKQGVAIELDGDPARQDLDHTLARRALARRCIFAVDSDAHATPELSYAETALAHARLARIPSERIVNCWPLERVREWLANPAREARS